MVGGQRAEGWGDKAGKQEIQESRKRKRSEDRGRRTEDRGQRAEDRGQRTVDGGRRTEDGGRRTGGRGGQAPSPKLRRTRRRTRRTGDRGGINIQCSISNVQCSSGRSGTGTALSERSYREGAEEQPSPATNSQVGEAGRGRPAPGRRRGSGRGGEVAKAITGTRGGRGGRGWRRGRRGFRRGGWGRQSRRSAGAVRRSGSCRCSCSPWRGRGRRCRG